MSRRRLDAELVRRGLVPTAEAAVAAVVAGRVTVSGAPALRGARMVAPGEAVVVIDEPPEFVSRGGHKLEAAIREFSIDVGGRRCLDAGASTGGFTDCLLQHDAAHVVAVDVGYGQLAMSLRNDPRVEVRDRTNVRHLTSSDVDPHVDLVVGDLSFISLRKVMPALLAVSRPDATMVLLVKPQFEASRAQVKLGRGVIRDPEVWRTVSSEIVSAITAPYRDEPVCVAMGFVLSPVHGPEGNREFLVHLQRGVDGVGATSLSAQIDAAVDAAATEAQSIERQRV